MAYKIPFNKILSINEAVKYLTKTKENYDIGEEGNFFKNCSEWLNSNHNSLHSIITHSCTGALEVAAILSKIIPGDEVIIPSFTFVSTASAFALRGAILKFADIDINTLNIDASKIEKLITSKTKIIIVVHYAGVSCDMDKIMKIAKNYNLTVIEDAAQAICSKYKGRPCGSIGEIGCLSFHQTKNINCGKGGAILINKENLIERSEVITSKGTNRSAFLSGKVDKYTWTDLGSSYRATEILCAILNSQLKNSKRIIQERLDLWNYYYYQFSKINEEKFFNMPHIPSYSEHNAHIFYIILDKSISRKKFILDLKSVGIEASFHYIPLHSSPFGKEYSKKNLNLPITDYISKSIVRFPIWPGLKKREIDFIAENVNKIFKKI